MCTSPSWWTPMSTNTPKSMTLRTVPVSSMPGFKSFISSTSVRRMGRGSSSRGSRPGFTSSPTMSRRVGTPTPHASAAFSSPYAATRSRSPSRPPAFTADRP